MDREIRLKQMRFRAWHRGTREADFMIGGFFDRYGESWSDKELDWFDHLLEEQDVDVMAWAMGTLPVPPVFQGEQMTKFQKLDFINIPK